MKQGLKRALALLLALMLAVPAFALADEPVDGIIEIDGGVEAFDEVQPDIGEEPQLSLEDAGEILLEDVGTEFQDGLDGVLSVNIGDLAAPAEPFDQAVTVDDVTITVIAGAGVFPAGASLRVTKVSDADIARAVEAAIGAEGVYTHRQYRIEVLDGAGNVIRSEYEHDWPTVRVEGLNLPADARVTAYDEYVPGAYEIDVAVVPDEDAVEFEFVDFTVYDIITVEALTGEAEEPAGQPEEEAPVEEEPAEEEPAEEQPAEEEPAEEQPAEEAPAEEEPAEEQPAEEAPAEEAPAEEEPAEEEPAEEAPVAEEPAEQPTEAEAEEPADQPTEAEAEEPAEQPAEAEAEEPADQPTEDEPSQPAPFFQSATVDGVTVTVQAEAGAFPEGAALSVRKVSAETAEAVDAAVADAQEGAQATLTSYTFDISILDAEGNELQPAEGFDVQVSFALAEAADESVRASVYHIDETGGDMTAEKLNVVNRSGDTVTAVTDGFSLYNLTLASANAAGETITYVLADGKTEQAVSDWQELTEYNIGGGGWYAVTKETDLRGSLNVNSDANLILCDGALLTCYDGIYIVAGATLTIWGQKGGTGKLTAYDKIGGTAWNDGGNLVVNGGDIHATGKSSTRAAGIGGGEGHAMQSVTINGGKVRADGANGGAGIGAGFGGNASGMTVTINGGEVTACSNGKGAGIGGGDETWLGAGGEGATVHINGGWVFATSDGCAIGRGNTDNVMGTLTIADDLKVEAGNGWPDFVERTFTTPERVAACQWRKSARISKCGHDQWHWDNNVEGHMKVCEICATAFPREAHTLDEKEVCETCGYDKAAARVTYVLADGVTEAEKFDLPDVPLDMADGNWYVVRKDTTFNDGMGVGSDANLILCDGVTLTCNDGIYVRANATLTIYGQKGGTGKIITRSETKTGIGGLRNAVGGHIVINGGTIEATGGKYCAGIGGGEDNFCQSVTINNGTVTATGGKHGAGIGGGEEAIAVQITITGGKVTATGGEGGAGIGGGYKSHAEHINISGGKVTAISGDVTDGSGAAIGTGGNCKTEWVSNDSIEISGGEINAMAGKNSVVYEDIYGSKNVAGGGSGSAAIGGGTGCSNPRITISGGTVKADAIARGGAAIGSGRGADMAYPVEISGGKVTAYGGTQSAGIGAGYQGNLTSEVLISGGEVTALSNKISISGGYSGSQGSGIGTGVDGTLSGKVTITGGKVNATGGYLWTFYKGRHNLGRYGSAGIGSEQVSGTITISGGDVTATGGMFSAGIGSSGSHEKGDVSGTINISGGTVRAYGAQIGDPPLDMPTGGAGIGTGGMPNHKGVLSGSINISGGTVYAEGCKDAVVLGGEGVYERGDPYPHSPHDDYDYFYWVEIGWQDLPGPGIGSVGDITGSINITGGTVHASADALSPGIGSLYSNRGTIRITGGNVYAKGGKNSVGAIGRGNKEQGTSAGTIILGDTMAVRQGINDKKPNPWEAAAERLAAITKYGEVTAKPCDHSVKFAIETETHQGYCEWCALSFEKEKHIFDEDGNCVVCGEGVEEPTFRTHSLSLSGNIAVNFMVQLPKGMDIKGTYMEFAVNGETSRQDTDADRRDANGVGYYRFTRSLNSIQMAEPIKAVFYYGDGKTIEQTYSIQQYIQDYEEKKGNFDAETTALVHALADYGHYAQPALAEARGWVIGRDYAEMTTFYTEGYDYDAVKDSLSDYTIKKTSNDKDYEKTTVALDLLSETRLDVYVAYKEGTDKIVSVSADGNWLQNLKLRDAKDGRVYAHFDELRAQQLSDRHTVVCTAGGKKVTVEASALGYIHDVLASEQTAKLKDCVCALYNYHKATVAYRKKHG